MLRIFVFKRRALYIALTILVLLIVGVTVLVALSGSDETFSETIKYASKKISAEQAKVLMEKNPDLIVYDIRNEKEYLQGHLPQATLISQNELKKKLAQLDQEKIYMLYGKDDKSSEKAAETLSSNGFSRVYILSGGVEEWPYELE
ncbi:MAG: rhodanese-like domain-containing protein [Thermotaleaceae bacterium]